MIKKDHKALARIFSQNKSNDEKKEHLRKTLIGEVADYIEKEEEEYIKNSGINVLDFKKGEFIKEAEGED